MKTFFPGARVRVFDSSLFVDDVSTPLSLTVRNATVVRWYGRRSPFGGVHESMIDVVFDHRPDHRISRGHFTEGLE